MIASAVAAMASAVTLLEYSAKSTAEPGYKAGPKPAPVTAKAAPPSVADGPLGMMTDDAPAGHVGATYETPVPLAGRPAVTFDSGMAPTRTLRPRFTPTPGGTTHVTLVLGAVVECVHADGLANVTPVGAYVKNRLTGTAALLHPKFVPVTRSEPPPSVGNNASDVMPAPGATRVIVGPAYDRERPGAGGELG